MQNISKSLAITLPIHIGGRSNNSDIKTPSPLEVNKSEYNSEVDIDLTSLQDKAFVIVKWMDPDNDSKSTWTLISSNNNKVIKAITVMLSSKHMLQDYNNQTNLSAIDSLALETVNKESEIYGDRVCIVSDVHLIR